MYGDVSFNPELPDDSKYALYQLAMVNYRASDQEVDFSKSLDFHKKALQFEFMIDEGMQYSKCELALFGFALEGGSLRRSDAKVKCEAVEDLPIKVIRDQWLLNRDLYDKSSNLLDLEANKSFLSQDLKSRGVSTVGFDYLRKEMFKTKVNPPRAEPVAKGHFSLRRKKSPKPVDPYMKIATDCAQEVLKSYSPEGARAVYDYLHTCYELSNQEDDFEIFKTGFVSSTLGRYCGTLPVEKARNFTRDELGVEFNMKCANLRDQISGGRSESPESGYGGSREPSPSSTSRHPPSPVGSPSGTAARSLSISPHASRHSR